MKHKPLTDYDREEVVLAPPLALSLHWKDGRLIELRAKWAKTATESEGLSKEGQELKAALVRYVAGNQPNWPDLPFDFSLLTDFQRTVLDALYQIPSGEVRTYGELAADVGKPKGAQAIGRAMATNPFPIVYPCHRVIGASGELTGFSAEGGLELKEFLLKHEGAWDAIAHKKRPPESGQPSLMDYLETD